MAQLPPPPPSIGSNGFASFFSLCSTLIVVFLSSKSKNVNVVFPDGSNGSVTFLPFAGKHVLQQYPQQSGQVGSLFSIRIRGIYCASRCDIKAFYPVFDVVFSLVPSPFLVLPQLLFHLYSCL